MSLIGMQTALAAIIRHPRASYQWNPEVFLKPFDLSVSELRVIESLSQHQELNKYGHGQADARLEVMSNHVDRVPRFIPKRVLKNIWFDLFEPAAIYRKSDLKGYFETSIAFLNFLREDKEARKRLKRSSPVFIFDLIAFEIAELELSRHLCLDTPLNKESVLSHPHFRVVDFEFDIPGWLNKPEEDDVSAFTRPLTLVFVRVENKFPKIYEIHKEFKNYLLSQISEGPVQVASESIKKDLKTMGLIAKM
jgi:hypothetical protein